jgi:hypothetical protein
MFFDHGITIILLFACWEMSKIKYSVKKHLLLYFKNVHSIFLAIIIIRTMKSTRIGWAGHIALMGEDCMWDSDVKAGKKETTRKT